MLLKHVRFRHCDHHFLVNVVGAQLWQWMAEAPDVSLFRAYEDALAIPGLCADQRRRLLPCGGGECEAKRVHMPPGASPSGFRGDFACARHRAIPGGRIRWLYVLFVCHFALERQVAPAWARLVTPDQRGAILQCRRVLSCGSERSFREYRRLDRGTDKSGVVVFFSGRRKRRPHAVGTFSVGSTELQRRSLYRYLGVLMSEHWKTRWSAQVVDVLRRSTVAANMVVRLLRDITRHGGPRLPLIRQFVLSTVIPIISYGMPFWAPTTARQLQQLQSVYVRSLEAGLGVGAKPHALSVLVECGVADN